MKRFFAWILDILFYVSLLFFVGAIAIADIYFRQRDITLVNTLLQTQLLPTMLAFYCALVVLYLFYFVFIPRKLSGTLGQRLIGLSYESFSGLSLGNLFLKVIVGRFWDFLLFPYTIYTRIKRRDTISTKISGVVLIPSQKPQRKAFYVLVAIFGLLFIGSVGTSTYIYRTGVSKLMEQLTDYKRQVEKLITLHAYQDAKSSLVKYVEYNGQTEDYFFYNCEIESNLSSDEKNIEHCVTALEKNSSNEERVKEITFIQAKNYASNSDFDKAAVEYEKVWTTYGNRTLEMKDYVFVLSELGKNDKAKEVLDELVKNIAITDAGALKDIADLYDRVGDPTKALETYRLALTSVEGKDPGTEGELHYSIGVLLYSQLKYKEAKESFLKAKELNKDYAEAAESYIILIDDLAKSITK